MKPSVRQSGALVQSGILQLEKQQERPVNAS